MNPACVSIADQAHLQSGPIKAPGAHTVAAGVTRACPAARRELASFLDDDPTLTMEIEPLEIAAAAAGAALQRGSRRHAAAAPGAVGRPRAFLALAVLALLLFSGMLGLAAYDARRPRQFVPTGTPQPMVKQVPSAQTRAPARASPSAAGARLVTAAATVATAGSPAAPIAFVRARPSAAPGDRGGETGVGMARVHETPDQLVADRSAARARDRVPPAEAAPASGVAYDGRVRIVRTPAASKHERLAYAAFRAGDITTAAKHYASALEQQPEARDALLGMAAVAIAQRQLPRARRYYAQVLRHYPADRTASIALSGLRAARHAPAPSHLRRSDDDDRTLAYINFIRGRWLAARGRWRAAELAFLRALRARPRNPDYAFSVAMSLDHQGELFAAREFYRRAIALTGRRAAAPDRAPVRASGLDARAGASQNAWQSVQPQ